MFNLRFPGMLLFVFFLPFVSVFFSCASAEVTVEIDDSGITASAEMKIPRIFRGIDYSDRNGYPGSLLFYIPGDNPGTRETVPEGSSVNFTRKSDSRFHTVSGDYLFADMESFLSYCGKYVSIEQAADQITIVFNDLPDLSNELKITVYQICGNEIIKISVNNRGVLYSNSIAFSTLLEEKKIILEKT